MPRRNAIAVPSSRRPPAVAAVAGALVAFLAFGAAHAAPPWVGKWAASTHWCDPAHPGGAAPIEITSSGHESAGHECIYTSIERDGQARWHVKAECVGPAGIPYRERFQFEMRGDNLAITYPDRGGADVLQMRCP